MVKVSLQKPPRVSMVLTVPRSVNDSKSRRRKQMSAKMLMLNGRY